MYIVTRFVVRAHSQLMFDTETSTEPDQKIYEHKSSGLSVSRTLSSLFALCTILFFSGSFVIIPLGPLTYILIVHYMTDVTFLIYLDSKFKSVCIIQMWLPVNALYCFASDSDEVYRPTNTYT